MKALDLPYSPKGVHARIVDAINGMPSHFDPAAAPDLRATYQVNIEGDGGGRWHFRIEDQKLTMGEGEADAPDTTISLPIELVSEMFQAQSTEQAALAALRAWWNGRLKIEGSWWLAFQLRHVLH